MVKGDILGVRKQSIHKKIRNCPRLVKFNRKEGKGIEELIAAKNKQKGINDKDGFKTYQASRLLPIQLQSLKICSSKGFPVSELFKPFTFSASIPIAITFSNGVKVVIFLIATGKTFHVSGFHKL
jgi:hypothetical protein